MKRVRFDDMTWDMLVWVYLTAVEALQPAKKQGSWEYVPAPEREFSNKLVSPQGIVQTFRTWVEGDYARLSWTVRLLYELRCGLHPLDQPLPDSVRWFGRNERPKGWEARAGDRVVRHHSPLEAMVLLAIRQKIGDVDDYPIPDALLTKAEASP